MDGKTDAWTDGRTENQMPISHLAKAGATKILFILAILYISLHMVLGSGGSDETGWSQG